VGWRRAVAVKGTAIPVLSAVGARRYDLKKVMRLCIPVDTSGTPAASGNAKRGSIYRNAWQPLCAIRFELIANNAINRLNLGTPVGSLSSPFFGNSISLAGSPFSRRQETLGRRRSSYDARRRRHRKFLDGRIL
jgi:hypothetical protein